MFVVLFTSVDFMHVLQHFAQVPLLLGFVEYNIIASLDLHDSRSRNCLLLKVDACLPWGNVLTKHLPGSTNPIVIFSVVPEKYEQP